jgi:dTDP-D-glucose 4,6-dehydratase
MPTGPRNRVAANGLARELLGWTPQVPLREGLRRTISWYFANRTPEEARRALVREELPFAARPTSPARAAAAGR